MKTPHRISFAPVLGVFLVLLMANGSIQGQQLPPDLQIRPTPTRLHVTGYLRKGKCTEQIKGKRLQVVESWHILRPTGDLDRPGTRLVRERDRLAIGGRPLEQGRVLGEVTLTGYNQNFDIEWTEGVPISGLIPWVRGAYIERTGEGFTAYRLLSLRVLVTSSFFHVLNPLPIITFFNAETRKNLGAIYVDCNSIGG